MHEVYLIPDWFFHFGVVMEVLFSIVTLAVAVAGFAVYRISKDSRIKSFSIGFFMIAVSYAAWAALNLHIASKLADGTYTFSLITPPIMHILGVYVYIVFFIAGLVTLAYTTLNTDKGEFYYLALGLALVAIVSSVSKFVTFRIVSFFLLTFIAYYYFTECYPHKNKKACLILAAFALLVLSNIFYIFISSTPLTYVIGHVMELGAYSMILFTLLRTLKQI